MKSDVGFGENAPGAGSNPVDLGLFQREMQELIVAGPSEIEGAVAAVRSLLHLPGAYAVAYFRCAESRRLRPASPLICHNSYADDVRGHEPRLVDAVERMMRVEGPIAYPLGDAPFNIYVYPLGAPGNVTGAIALFAQVETTAVEHNPLILAAGLVAAELSHVHLKSPELQALDDQLPAPVASLPNHAGSSEGAADSAKASLDPSAAFGSGLAAELIGDMVSSRQDETVQVIGHRLASRLESHLGASQVMLGLADKKKRRCKLLAMSGMPTFAERSPLVTQAEELLAESILHDEIFEASISARPHELTSAEHSLLHASDAEALVHGPLRDPNGTKVGAWVVVKGTQSGANEGSLYSRVEEVQPLVGGLVGLLSRIRRHWLGRTLRKLTLPADDTVGRRRVWLATLAIGALMLCPVPYRVTCDTELFPVTHRFVPAPYEGVLVEVLVEAGDLVKAGQVLARMDANELELELAEMRAEFMQASKRRDSSVAQQDASASQMAQLEMERLQAKTNMLKNRRRKLEVKSPVDGIILGGESKKLEGARIKVGENLFETGPLERMVAEIYVSDDEIARVQSEQRVTVRLDAFPFRTFRGTIERISPRTETHRDANVFVAEVELDNFKDLLRPGMVGRGKISTGWRPIAWTLFHKPFDQLLRVLRW